MYTAQETLQVVKTLQTYHDVANRPNKRNDISINNQNLTLKKNSKILYQKKINSETIRKQLEKVEYKKNVFNSSDVTYSPFEADRLSAKSLWKKNYNNIDFPKFISVVLISLMVTEKMPDIIDCCNIYLMAYTEVVPDGQAIDRTSYMTDGFDDRKSVGQKITYTDGKKITNQVRRFKKEYIGYVKGLPFNEFTTEQLCNRIYKVYGSAVRDVYTMIRLNDFGVDTYYSLLDDLHGIDGIIGGIPYYGYTKTGAGNDFRKKKLTERHPELNAELGIALQKSVQGKGGVYIVSDKVLETVAQAVLNKEIDSMKVIAC